MSNIAGQGLTTNPRTGQVFRVQAPKQRSAAFAALEAAVVAAKEAQGFYMRNNDLAFDGVRRLTVRIANRVPLEEGPIKTELDRLLAATRAAQQAVKAYKTSHPAEFQQQAAVRGSIPTINVPKRRNK